MRKREIKKIIIKKKDIIIEARERIKKNQNLYLTEMDKAMDEIEKAMEKEKDEITQIVKAYLVINWLLRCFDPKSRKILLHIAKTTV